MERTNCKCLLEMKWNFSQHLKQFWKWLWGIKMSRKIVCFHWLLVHKAILVNGWRKGNVGKVCPFFSKKEYTPLIKYIHLYTTLVPFSCSPSLNFRIILSSFKVFPLCWLYKSSPPDVYLHLGDISYLSYTFTYVSNRSISGYIYLLVIHGLSIHIISIQQQPTCLFSMELIV